MLVALPAAALAVLIALAAPALAGGTDADAMPTASVRPYEPYSRNAIALLGRMMLGTGSAKFAEIKGTMHLEAAGEMPADTSSMTGGALVFRVKNAEALFRVDRQCSDPIRWLGVKPAAEGRIWVTFLTLKDFRTYRPSSGGVCSGSVYTLAE